MTLLTDRRIMWPDVHVQVCRFLQELFKKAAYLSNGSIDNRPTFQRDAVDDMPMGNPDDPTRFSWTDEALGRGNAGVGAGYGTIVMAKRGAKRQPRAPLQALPIQVGSIRQQSAPGLVEHCFYTAESTPI